MDKTVKKTTKHKKVKLNNQRLDKCRTIKKIINFFAFF